MGDYRTARPEEIWKKIRDGEIHRTDSRNVRGIRTGKPCDPAEKIRGGF